MVRTPVPEAAIDEDGDPGAREHDVRANRSRLLCQSYGVINAISETQREKGRPQSFLRLRIAPAVASHGCAGRQR